ncbi:MAG TPA: aminomethyltransferase family protein [Pseudomonadales bacterium]|jgi:aminomethyltransferase|nr:aminomethyltransferase family protein [Pseudomonadales bacterium]MDP6314809.1 aminomethyltransferase family protein [Pseudomonadales bacterium]MDP7575928.1 aminomethyltransferase family protein [Pseudomonadales bacterium]HJL61204.1 aminomethyltransferase family protein [Pseudomonadales bacterium]|tara:strand:- start:5456 stop:6652 length:1197 start_codon:yes stop_codon:yes gene_type:complete
MKKSPFFDLLNRRAGKDFDDFLASSVLDQDYIDWNDFALPNDYGNAEEEYFALRNGCAIFDVSPMRKYRISGEEAGDFLDKMLTRPVSDAESNRGIYVIFCNEDGTLKDDSILYKFSEIDYLLMPSDIDHESYFKSLAERFHFHGLSIVDCTDQWQGVAFQGPHSAAVLHNMGYEGVDQLKPYEVRRFPFVKDQIHIARMGFTADLGYECWLRPELCREFMAKIESVRESMSIDLPGYGLSVLEACRLEGGFIVAGWDFATEVDSEPGFERNPFEVGLGWLVKLDAGDFVGRDALLNKKQEGSQYLIRSFQTADPRELEDGVAIYSNINNEEIAVGSVNCSGWSWGLERKIGNASILSDYINTKDHWIVLDGQPVEITLSRGSFLNLARRHQVPAPLA